MLKKADTWHAVAIGTWAVSSSDLEMQGLQGIFFIS